MRGPSLNFELDHSVVLTIDNITLQKAEEQLWVRGPSAYENKDTHLRPWLILAAVTQVHSLDALSVGVFFAKKLGPTVAFYLQPPRATFIHLQLSYRCRLSHISLISQTVTITQIRDPAGSYRLRDVRFQQLHLTDQSSIVIKRGNDVAAHHKHTLSATFTKTELVNSNLTMDDYDTYRVDFASFRAIGGSHVSLSNLSAHHTRTWSITTSNYFRFSSGSTFTVSYCNKITYLSLLNLVFDSGAKFILQHSVIEHVFVVKDRVLAAVEFKKSGSIMVNIPYFNGRETVFIVRNITMLLSTSYKRWQHSGAASASIQAQGSGLQLIWSRYHH